MDTENQRDYFSLLIPAYLRGDLEPEKVLELEAAAKRDPEIAADIDLQRNIKEVVTLSDEMSAEGGWEKLQAAMRSEITETPKNAPSLALVSSENEATETKRVLAANSNEHKGVSPFWRIAAVALAIVGVTQFSLSGANNETSRNLYLTASEAGHVPNATLKLGFSQTAILSDLTDILAETGGKIINGPSALGLYSVTFESSESCLEAHAKLSRKDTSLDVETLSECE
jgi:hypothetical protein